METIIIVTHEVREYEKWEEAFYAGAGMRHDAGLIVLGVYRDLSNENIITVISEAPTPEVAAAFTGDPGMKAIWAEIGVIGEPEIRILRKVK